MNWKRGLTRVYFTVWASWLVFVVARTLLLPVKFSFAPTATAIVLIGLVAPAILLLALRWVWSGFASSFN